MKKTYSAPSAELIALLPKEEIAANWTWNWNWGTFSGAASATATNEVLWNDIYNGDDGSYKYDP